MTQVHLKAEGRDPGEDREPPETNDMEFWIGRTTRGKLVRFGILIVLALLIALAPQ